MIINEAHNIEKVWEYISSFEIDVHVLNETIQKLNMLQKNAIIYLKKKSIHYITKRDWRHQTYNQEV